MATAPTPDASGAPPADPVALLRTPAYLRLLVLAGLIGLPVSAIAYGFLELVSWLQHALYTSLPGQLGLHPVPVWWPAPLLAVGASAVALGIRFLPGSGGHPPTDGFQTGQPTPPIDLAGIVVAALATLAVGAVLGPEGPLIAIGGGLGVLTVRLARREAPPMAAVVIGAAGSFAAVSTLLGSPLIGAFLLLEAVGLGGPMLGVLLVPGLLAAGIGTLIFVGLDALTGLGTFSLALPNLPHIGAPTGVMFLWALCFGVAAALYGTVVRRGARWLRPFVERRLLWLTPVVGLAVAGVAIGFTEATGRSSAFVLFSGQSALPRLIGHAGTWTVGALLMLVLCKGLAYGLSLSSFRGGPIFPAMFIGAAGGVAASHLPGLTMVPAVAMGIGAMSTVMLGLPLTSTLLATLLLAGDGAQVMPLVIVAVVVAYVATARLTPPATPPVTPAPAPAAPEPGTTAALTAPGAPAPAGSPPAPAG